MRLTREQLPPIRHRAERGAEQRILSAVDMLNLLDTIDALEQEKSAEVEAALRRAAMECDKKDNFAREIQRRILALIPSGNHLAHALRLKNKNGSFVQRVFDEVLTPANCGVAGHFKFQENGGHCLQCQSTTRALREARRDTVNLLARWILHKDDCAKCSGQHCTCDLDVTLTPIMRTDPAPQPKEKS